MTDTFSGADQSPANKGSEGQGSSFSQDQGQQGGTELTADQLALQQRDQHAQAHIKTLETENEAFRGEMKNLADRLDKLGDVDSIMERLSKTQGEGIDRASLIEEVTSGIKKSMSAEQAEKTQADNFTEVSKALVSKFGDKTDEQVQKACEENDMTLEAMIDLSKPNPKLALKLCGGDKQVVSAQPSSGTSINTQGLYSNGQERAPDTVGFDYVSGMSEGERIRIFIKRLADG